MAKRKRLELPVETDIPAIETNQTYSGMSRMPIAEVAGDTAARAALDEVSRTLSEAESDGRMVRRLALESIDAGHLNRDRMVLEEGEMAALTASLAARGQQAPIEVLALPGNRFGLISGLRRLEALRSLGETEILAFVRKPAGAAASYVAMVEENEIRASLSFYERANIVVEAVRSGVYPNTKKAVKELFIHVTPARRSKILNFVVLREALGRHLSHPAAIPEKLGLALAAAINADGSVATRICDVLRKMPPADAAAERRVLERALKAHGKAPKTSEEVALGVTLKVGRGRVTLCGSGVDAEFEADLRAWLAARNISNVK